MKNILGVHSAPRRHWVGDGFPVSSLLSYDRLGAERISPFLLLDHAGPHHFAPGQHRRGVGIHPHRGFETVTFVHKGEVSHRDSSGGGGTIGPGDVQWMTAGNGILHEEYHSDAFSQTGGELDMLQLWVNLPSRHKSTPARYQGLTSEHIPKVPLAGDSGYVKVVAGRYAGITGPAQTFTPVNAWEVVLAEGAETSLSLPNGHTSLLVALEGTLLVQRDQVVRSGNVVELSREGQDVALAANTAVRLLVLTGEPLDEPVVGHGPFVMSTEEEIQDSIAAFQRGEFGHLPH
ncbi:pirin family protein [Halomonas denitrificans]|uniref:pirin family protein n=1 Tax=Halomonas TaxID=2745 RepID=UPI001C96A316|nr:MULTISPECIES: pirin family protein [Halomonas]MBY5927218.1 pirin family protein [Halomonas sp. DP4Y7-2]MBY6027877.1 pirin family protein [Halomonas sp. DP8Y7-1]MBY6234260.1 pirin family protein [Halomonas sp. DP4Y7-1]MCA0973001.1 pirin family protein [Halomonas denitrificans]